MNQPEKSVEAKNISCLLCFVCAHKYPCVKSSRNQKVGWVQRAHGKNETILYYTWQLAGSGGEIFGDAGL